MTSLLISGGRVVDGNGGSPIESGDVLIENGIIAGVGARGSLRAEGADRLDATGTTLIPGLINMHVHLHPWVRDVDDWGAYRLRYAQPDIALLRGVHNAQLALSWGVTTLRDAGCVGRLSQTIRDAVASGLLVGPRVISAGRMITTSAGHGWPVDLHADNADELRKAVRQLVQDGVDTIKIAATGGGGTPGTNVAAAQYTAEELTAAVTDAHRLGKRVLVHAHGAAGIRNAIVAQVDTIEHFSWVGADGQLEVDQAAVASMIKKDITAVPTMSVSYRPSQEDAPALSADQRRMHALRAERSLAWKAMYEAGVRFATGTDNWDPFARELELMVSEMGLTPLAAITSATRDGAIALGLQHEIGTIEQGKAADLVQLLGDPTADLAALRRVERVWRSGRLLVQNGRVII